MKFPMIVGPDTEEPPAAGTHTPARPLPEMTFRRDDAACDPIGPTVGKGAVVMTSGAPLPRPTLPVASVTNAAGTAALGNAGDGVLIESGSSTTVGGFAVAARNVISGNAGSGVRVVLAGGITRVDGTTSAGT